jgi:pimeloyl-ACP methyl ester carboxylesterase
VVILFRRDVVNIKGFLHSNSPVKVDDLDNPSELNAGLKMCFINLDICNRIALRDTDLRSDLVKIKIPTVIMHGKKDKICSFDLAGLMKTGISGSQIVAFENSGHSMFLEEMDKFNSELIKFAKK